MKKPKALQPLRSKAPTLDYQAEKAREAFERANKLELANKQKRGEIVKVSSVQRVWSAMLSNFRSRVLAIPNKCLPLIEGATSKAEVRAILDRAVRECLLELSELEPSKVKDEAD